MKQVFFYWGGDISESRLRILKDCMYSTKAYNPDREIVLCSNSLTADMFDPRFGIRVITWDSSLFEGSPIDPLLIDRLYSDTWERNKSDIVRMGLLYKFGGSYVDTDDIAIKPMSDIPNLVCRSYDPHTCHYNKIPEPECISGKYREIRGYDNITMFPRNDCWQNFEPRSQFLHDLLSDYKIQSSEKPIGICDDFSWQSLTLEYLKKHLPLKTVNYGLTLLYLYEGHVSCSSLWDLGHFGGEMHDIWNTLPNRNQYEWGKYKCTKEVASDFMDKVLAYPYVSHLWLHDKDMNPEWLIEPNQNGKYALSTWMINESRNKVKNHLCSL